MNPMDLFNQGKEVSVKIDSAAAKKLITVINVVCGLLLEKDL